VVTTIIVQDLIVSVLRRQEQSD